MKPTISILLLALSTATQACTSLLWGQGTCDYPAVTEGGNGPLLSSAIVNQLATCFMNKFGPGPYEVDGTSPNLGGEGNEWAIYTTIDGNPYSLGVGNLCGCSQSMDANVFVDIAGAADMSGSLLIKEFCGANSDACPSDGAPGGGELAGGMYAYAYSCPSNPCDMEGTQNAQEC